jgi:hypothetical protein
MTPAELTEMRDRHSQPHWCSDGALRPVLHSSLHPPFHPPCDAALLLAHIAALEPVVEALRSFAARQADPEASVRDRALAWDDVERTLAAVDALRGGE